MAQDSFTFLLTSGVQKDDSEFIGRIEIFVLFLCVGLLNPPEVILPERMKF
jgi:hypothetical protein